MYSNIDPVELQKHLFQRVTQTPPEVHPQSEDVSLVEFMYIVFTLPCVLILHECYGPCLWASFCFCFFTETSVLESYRNFHPGELQKLQLRRGTKTSALERYTNLRRGTKSSSAMERSTGTSVYVLINRENHTLPRKGSLTKPYIFCHGPQQVDDVKVLTQVNEDLQLRQQRHHLLFVRAV